MAMLFVVGGIGLMLGCLFTLLRLGRCKRLKQPQLISDDQAKELDDAVNESFNDGFYCIMLTDGTTRTGFISQSKVK